MVEVALTPQQLAVIEHICSGGTIHSAATSVNVALKDILAWRREFQAFRDALELAFAERDFLHREQAAALVDLAYQALREILSSDQASPSLKFRAAKFILEQATAPTDSERKSARPAAKSKPAPPVPQNIETCTKMHKSDFAGYDKICPCGSGKRFVDCCLERFLPKGFEIEPDQP